MIKTRIQLRFNDMDVQGHMYNGQYQHIFDLGKSDYFREVLGLGAMDGAEALVTVRVETNFIVPVLFSDQLEIHTRVERIGTKSFTVFQELVDLNTGTLKADSRTVLVGYNAVEGTTFAIPDIWRAGISEHEKVDFI